MLKSFGALLIRICQFACERQRLNVIIDGKLKKLKPHKPSVRRR